MPITHVVPTLTDVAAAISLVVTTPAFLHVPMIFLL